MRPNPSRRPPRCPPLQPGRRSPGAQASPLAVGAFFAVALALTGGVIAYTMFGADDRARGSAVEGVDEWEGLSNAHVPMDARVDCEMYPPAGGEHYDA